MKDRKAFHGLARGLNSVVEGSRRSQYCALVDSKPCFASARFALCSTAFSNDRQHETRSLYLVLREEVFLVYQALAHMKNRRSLQTSSRGMLCAVASVHKWKSTSFAMTATQGMTRASTIRKLLADLCVAEAYECSFCSMQVQLPGCESKRHRDPSWEARKGSYDATKAKAPYASCRVATQTTLQGAHICHSICRHRALLRKQAPFAGAISLLASFAQVTVGRKF